MEFIFIILSWMILLVPGFDDSVPPTGDKIFKIETSPDIVQSITIQSDESFDLWGFDIELKQNSTGILEIKIPKNLPTPASFIGEWSYGGAFVLVDGAEINYDIIEDPCYSHYKIPIEGKTKLEIVYSVITAGSWQLYNPIQFDEDNPCYSKVFYKKPIESPLKQHKSGTYIADIQCREGLVLVLKKSKEFHACVKHDTVPKLFERNWALNEVTIIDTGIVEQDSKLIKIIGVVERWTTPEGWEYHLIPLEQELPRIEYTGYDTVNLFATKDTIHHFLRNLDGKLVKIEGSFLLDDGKYFTHYSGFPTIPVKKLDVISDVKHLDYSIEGARLLSVTKIPDFNGLNIVLQETQNGSIQITIPRDLLDAKIGDSDDSFIVIIDGYEVAYTEVTNDFKRTLTISFEEGARMIQVIATVPT